jgi:hypothetical protein
VLAFLGQATGPRSRAKVAARPGTGGRSRRRDRLNPSIVGFVTSSYQRYGAPGARLLDPQLATGAISAAGQGEEKVWNEAAGPGRDRAGARAAVPCRGAHCSSCSSDTSILTFTTTLR